MKQENCKPMSERMEMYLTEYLAWVEAGAPEPAHFDTWMGLCTNILYWGRFRHLSVSGKQSMQHELSELLKASGLPTAYPFGGNDRYCHEGATHTHHKNELRLAWVRKQLGVK